ncbi:MAG: PBP1A family penicillin-binding protein [Pseudomonadota bacterium]
MRDWNSLKNSKKRLINWLALDSWLDSSLSSISEDFKRVWANLSDFFGYFHVTGIKRVITEFASEGFTLGTLGLAFVLILAMPAFEETKNNWRDPGKLSVTFLDRFGNEIGKRGILHDDAVPLDEIPEHMIKATLATEDRRFYEHFGIDFYGTFRAIFENFRANTVVQGGSSITQQLAKNLFLSPEQTLERKVKEAFLALWLEFHFSKDGILKLYLDRAYMGAGAIGVEAAARVYFDKSIRDVTLAEAAMLAGLYKAPSKFAPHINLPNSRARANEVLANMVEAGFLTEGQIHGARLNPATIVDKPNFYSPDYYLDWAFEEVQRIAIDKEDYVLSARTTIDINLQKFAQSTITTMLKQNARSKRVDQAALVAMETDGAVRAVVGGKDYGDSQFNRATKALRQPGSSFKPYVYLTALQHGYNTSSRVVDGYVSCNGWSPKNYSGGFRGGMDLSRALAKSINTIAVKLSLSVGRDKVLENVRKLGLTTPRRSCSMALGDTGVTLLQHTAGYTAFANGGKAVIPYGILELRNSSDEVIYTHDKEGPKPKQVFDREHIEQLNFMLGQVVTAGTGGRARLGFTTAAGKTGTSSSYKDGWFMGFTGQYVTGTWFGNDNFLPTNKVTGGNLPAMAWNQFMTFAHSTPNIPQIPGLPLHPKQIENMNSLANENPNTKAPKKTSKASSRLLSQRTYKVLVTISRLLKDAKPLDRSSQNKQNTDTKLAETR